MAYTFKPPTYTVDPYTGAPIAVPQSIRQVPKDPISFKEYKDRVQSGEQYNVLGEALGTAGSGMQMAGTSLSNKGNDKNGSIFSAIGGALGGKMGGAGGAGTKGGGAGGLGNMVGGFGGNGAGGGGTGGMANMGYAQAAGAFVGDVVATSTSKAKYKGAQIGKTAGGGIGGAVGAYFGGPMGAQMGQMAGSFIGGTIGNMVDNKKLHKEYEEMAYEPFRKFKEQPNINAYGNYAKGGVVPAGSQPMAPNSNYYDVYMDDNAIPDTVGDTFSKLGINLDRPRYKAGGMVGPGDPPSNLWRTDRRAFVDSTLGANKHLDFVKRLYDPNTPSIQVPGKSGRSTHLMSYDPGSRRVYPEVVNRNGNLVHLQGDDAWNYANDNKEFIEFKTPGQAKWFAGNGYKTGTGVLPKKFDEGGLVGEEDPKKPKRDPRPEEIIFKTIEERDAYENEVKARGYDIEKGGSMAGMSYINPKSQQYGYCANNITSLAKDCGVEWKNPQQGGVYLGNAKFLENVAFDKEPDVYMTTAFRPGTLISYINEFTHGENEAQRGHMKMVYDIVPDKNDPKKRTVKIISGSTADGFHVEEEDYDSLYKGIMGDKTYTKGYDKLYAYRLGYNLDKDKLNASREFGSNPEIQEEMAARKESLEADKWEGPRYTYKLRDDSEFKGSEPEGLQHYFNIVNDSNKLNDIADKLGVYLSTVHDSALNIPGILWEENKLEAAPTNMFKVGPGTALENDIEKIFKPKNRSIGPGQIKFSEIAPDLKEKFDIKKPADLFVWDKVIPLMIAIDVRNKKWMQGQGKNLSKKLMGEAGVSADELKGGVGRWSPYAYRGLPNVVERLKAEAIEEQAYEQGTKHPRHPRRAEHPVIDQARVDKYVEEHLRERAMVFDPGAYADRVYQFAKKNIERTSQTDINEEKWLRPITVTNKKMAKGGVVADTPPRKKKRVDALPFVPGGWMPNAGYPGMLGEPTAYDALNDAYKLKTRPSGKFKGLIPLESWNDDMLNYAIKMKRVVRGGDPYMKVRGMLPRSTGSNIDTSAEPIQSLKKGGVVGDGPGDPKPKPKYPAQRDVRPTIYLRNPYDPRIKNYNDSSFYHDWSTAHFKTIMDTAKSDEGRGLKMSTSQVLTRSEIVDKDYNRTKGKRSKAKVAAQLFKGEDAGVLAGEQLNQVPHYLTADFLNKNRNSYYYVPLYERPVQPYEALDNPETIPYDRPELNMNLQGRRMPNVDVNARPKPTDYSFTFRTKKGGQESLYFPDKGKLDTFMQDIPSRTIAGWSGGKDASRYLAHGYENYEEGGMVGDPNPFSASVNYPRVWNPNLAPMDKRFQTWYGKNTLEGQRGVLYDDKLDYDYYSFYKNKGKGNIKDHFPDTYKRPSHPTFSNESIYSTKDNPGGSWEGETFIPPKKMKNGGIAGGDPPKKKLQMFPLIDAPVIGGQMAMSTGVRQPLNRVAPTTPAVEPMQVLPREVLDALNKNAPVDVPKTDATTVKWSKAKQSDSMKNPTPLDPLMVAKNKEFNNRERIAKETLEKERQRARLIREWEIKGGTSNPTIAPKFTFPDGSEKTWSQMNSDEQFYVSGRNLGSMRYNHWTDHINPFVLISGMAENAGTMGYEAKRTGSIDPILFGVGTPLLTGAAARVGANTTGQFINNVFNPAAGLGSRIPSGASVRERFAKWFQRADAGKDAVDIAGDVVNKPPSGLDQTMQVPPTTPNTRPSYEGDTLGNYKNVLNRGQTLEDIRYKYHNNTGYLDWDEADMLNRFGKGEAAEYKYPAPDMFTNPMNPKKEAEIQDFWKNFQNKRDRGEDATPEEILEARINHWKIKTNDPYPNIITNRHRGIIETHGAGEYNPLYKSTIPEDIQKHTFEKFTSEEMRAKYMQYLEEFNGKKVNINRPGGKAASKEDAAFLNNWADYATKPLSPEEFMELMKSMQDPAMHEIRKTQLLGGWRRFDPKLKDPYPSFNKEGGIVMADQYGKGGWIKKAVNPKHKGYCTPMTKATCTPRRKALARTFKKHHGFHEEGGLINNNMRNNPIQDLMYEDIPQDEVMYMADGGYSEQGPPEGAMSGAMDQPQGPQQQQINIERGELRVKDFEIVQEYNNPNRFSKHHKDPMKEPIGNFVMVDEGDMIIPAKNANTFKYGDLLTRRSIMAELVKNQANNPQQNAPRTGGDGAEYAAAGYLAGEDPDPLTWMPGVGWTPKPKAPAPATVFGPGGPGTTVFGPGGPNAKIPRYPPASIQDPAANTGAKFGDPSGNIEPDYSNYWDNQLVSPHTLTPQGAQNIVNNNNKPRPVEEGGGINPNLFASEVAGDMATAFGITNALGRDPFLHYDENYGYNDAISYASGMETNPNLEASRAAIMQGMAAQNKQLNNIHSPSIYAQSGANRTGALKAIGDIAQQGSNMGMELRNQKRDKLGGLRLAQGEHQVNMRQKLMHELREDDANRGNLIHQGLSEFAVNKRQAAMDREGIRSLNAMSEWNDLTPGQRNLFRDQKHFNEIMAGLFGGGNKFAPGQGSTAKIGLPKGWKDNGDGTYTDEKGNRR